MAFSLIYKRYGERSILIEWPSKIEENILNDILQFKKIIANHNIKEIIELKSAYNSLLIVYSELNKSIKSEFDILKKLYQTKQSSIKTASRLWKIPVCYDTIFGIDLETISVEKKMSKQEIVKRHSQAVYTVYFIGFLPGFLYLGGLDDSLFIPRKSTPRLKIEKGAVSIGGNQTGVYPNESPGGWHIIGNTPIAFFNPKKETPCFAKAGDKIVFNPISNEDYQNIKALVEAGVYQLESEALDG